MENILELKKISLEINGEEILKDINLSFNKGEVVVITGQNGSGKTSLVKLIMGIMDVTSGSISYNGKDITNMPIDERARMGITMAFQQPVTFKGIKVKDMLGIANPDNNDLSKACEILSQVGLCARDYIDREINSSLSGGEQKRIELATAIAKGGEVFLFDEPEAGIDLWSFDNLIRIFEFLKNKTVIIVSHQKKILEIADRIVLLNKDSDPIIGNKEEIIPIINMKKCSALEGDDGQN